MKYLTAKLRGIKFSEKLSPQGRGDKLDINIYDLSLHVVAFKLTF
jgi:hypothetical protein